MTELLTEFGFVPGVALAVTAAVALVVLVTLAFVRVGSKRWKVVGEGVVDRIETLEVPASIAPMENGFIMPRVTMTLVSFTDGKRVEVPYDQLDKCPKGKRIRVSRNWLGERLIVHLD